MQVNFGDDESHFLVNGSACPRPLVAGDAVRLGQAHVEQAVDKQTDMASITPVHSTYRGFQIAALPYSAERDRQFLTNQLSANFRIEDVEFTSDVKVHFREVEQQTGLGFEYGDLAVASEDAAQPVNKITCRNTWSRQLADW